MGNIYISGHTRVIFGREDVPKRWSHREQTRQFMNKCFLLYYDGLKNSLTSERIRQIWSAADTGAWPGVSNLNEAMDYLWSRKGSARNRPWWNIEERERFTSKLGAGVVLAPAPFVSFMEEVESQAKNIQKANSKLRDAFPDAQVARDHDDWGALKQTLDKVNRTATWADRFMWVAPDSLANLAGHPTEQIASYSDALSKIHDAASIAGSLLVGDPDESSKQLLISAVGTLPILGSYYAEGVNAVFSAVATYKRIIKRREDQIWRASMGVDPSYSKY